MNLQRNRETLQATIDKRKTQPAKFGQCAAENPLNVAKSGCLYGIPTEIPFLNYQIRFSK
jgi:hypothetical protein